MDRTVRWEGDGGGGARRATGTPRTRWVLALCVVLGLSGTPVVAQEQDPPSFPRCGTGIPVSEASGLVPLPRGNVFCPLFADPKEVRSFASYLRGTREPFDTNIGSVGIGDSFGMLRIGRGRPGDGLQLSLTAAVFAQFDLDTESFELINADYIVGLPVTFRRGGFTARLRLYHQSSHLGDEFLLRGDPERENLAFEAWELILSREMGPLRIYAGGERLFNRDPADLEPTVAHVGVEIRPGPDVVRVGRIGTARLLAALDLKSSQEQDWSPAVSVRGGFEVGRPHFEVNPSRRWGLMAEYYEGPTPYGQFFRDDIAYFGVGLHFSL